MNRWKYLTIGLILASLAALVLIVIFQVSPWQWIRQAVPAWQGRPAVHNDLGFSRPVTMLGALLTLYLSGIVLVFLFPAHINRVSRTFSGSLASWLRLAALGLLASLLVMAAGVGSAFNIITFPVTFFLGGMLFLSVLVGTVGLAYAVGRGLLVKSGWQLSPLVALLLGDVLVFAATNLPWVGAATTVLITTLGLGAAIASRFGSGRSWSLNSLIEDGKE